MTSRHESGVQGAPDPCNWSAWLVQFWHFAGAPIIQDTSKKANEKLS